MYLYTISLSSAFKTESHSSSVSFSKSKYELYDPFSLKRWPEKHNNHRSNRSCLTTADSVSCCWPGWNLASHESSHLYAIIPLQDRFNPWAPELTAGRWKNNIPSTVCTDTGILTAVTGKQGDAIKSYSIDLFLNKQLLVSPAFLL